MTKFEFVVGNRYWCPKLGVCECVDTISIEHTSFFPVKLRVLEGFVSDKLHSEYVTEDGKVGLADKISSVYPIPEFSPPISQLPTATNFKIDSKYWCFELGNCICTNINNPNRSGLPITLKQCSDDWLVGTITTFVNPDGRINSKDSHPSVFERNPFAHEELGYSGRSTRIIDSAVQEFFKNGSVTIRDHHPSNRADRGLFDIFLKRLKNEHGLTSDHVHVNVGTFTAKMK